MNVGLLLDGITTGAILFLVTLGLLMIFGMMRIMNFAYGAFITVGAYATVITTERGISPWWALTLGPLLAAVVAAVVEPLVVRRLYSRPIDMILATWGISIVLTELLTIYFGRGAQPVVSPDLGALSIGDTSYPIYRLVLVPIALLIAVLLMFVLRGTRFGLIGRAVIMDETLAQNHGVNISLVRFVTFVVGSALAGLAGALLAPISSVDPNLGLGWLIMAFMLALLVGVSVPSLLVASLVMGFIQVGVASVLGTTFATLVIPVLVVLLLRFRPAGFIRQSLV